MSLEPPRKCPASCGHGARRASHEGEAGSTKVGNNMEVTQMNEQIKGKTEQIMGKAKEEVGKIDQKSK